jgi:small-conductance mechanosensitive channel
MISSKGAFEMTAKYQLDTDQLRKIREDILDSIDEELEMAIEDGENEFDPLANAEERQARTHYFRELLRLQGELVKLQDWVVATKQKVVILFEGRDAAGKGGVIKRITQRLNPRVCRVTALPAPMTEKERSGISNATWPIYLQQAKSFYLTAAGTTELELSASWDFVPTMNTKNFSEVFQNLKKC